MTRFRLKERIGSGGMATVYAAEWLFPAGETIPVACKILRADRDKEGHTGLFWREAAISLRISHNHPRLVSVHECFSLDRGELCMVMELVEGCRVADLLEMTSPLPAAVVRRIAVDVLDGLHYMHSLDVLHRDISPANILVSRQGEVKIADLGLAKPIPEGRGQASNSFCTFAYASPEVLRRGTVDPRSDLYSLGAVMYELVAGYPPYSDNDINRILDRAKRGQLAPLADTVPADLRTMIMGVLHMDPAQRQPSSAKEALSMLDQDENALAGRDVLARMVKPVHAKKRQERTLCRESRPKDSIEAPIVLLGATADEWEKRPTEKEFQIRHISDEEPPVIRRGWLRLALALAVLVLVPLGAVGWRALANGSDPSAPTMAPARVDQCADQDRAPPLDTPISPPAAPDPAQAGRDRIMETTPSEVATDAAPAVPRAVSGPPRWRRPAATTAGPVDTPASQQQPATGPGHEPTTDPITQTTASDEVDSHDRDELVEYDIVSGTKGEKR